MGMAMGGRRIWPIRMRTRMPTVKLNPCAPDPSLEITRLERIRTGTAVNGFLTLESPECVSDYAGTATGVATAVFPIMVSRDFSKVTRLVRSTSSSISDTTPGRSIGSLPKASNRLRVTLATCPSAVAIGDTHRPKLAKINTGLR